MPQYPIPQFIEEEGRIIFFLTFRQFFLIVGGGAVCLLLYFTVPSPVFVVGAVLTIILVGIIAFLKINNESVVKIFVNFIMFLTKEKNYTWQKKELPYPFAIQVKPEIKAEPEHYIPELKTQYQTSKLKEIRKMIETKR